MQWIVIKYQQNYKTYKSKDSEKKIHINNQKVYKTSQKKKKKVNKIVEEKLIRTIKIVCLI